jgi:hypothetical protein
MWGGMDLQAGVPTTAVEAEAGESRADDALGLVAVDEKGARPPNSEAMGSGDALLIMTCRRGRRGLRGCTR